MNATLEQLNREITACTKCPRLVEWRENVATEKVRRFRHETYWGRPVPGFGDPQARLLIVGLAPAAHGANRTGRMFTGDRSGDWLYRSLHKFGFANQVEAHYRNDGLSLQDCYITAAVRCAPPQNKPMREERENCLGYLEQEIRCLQKVQVVVVLGKIAFDTIVKLFVNSGKLTAPRKPKFSHAAVFSVYSELTLIASYHPSQQNTFTGRLTEPMFDLVFEQAKNMLN